MDEPKLNNGKNKGWNNLVPAKKGEVRNPKGRPKKGYAIADILNEIGQEEVTLNGHIVMRRRVILMRVISEAMKGTPWAVEFWANRTEGKAVQRQIVQHIDIVSKVIDILERVITDDTTMAQIIYEFEKLAMSQKVQMME